MKGLPNTFDIGEVIEAGGRGYRLIERKEQDDTANQKAYVVYQVKPSAIPRRFVKKFRDHHEYKKLNHLKLSELEMKQRGII